MKNSKPLPAEIYKLEEAVGNFMQYWGFKKIRGRMWVHLFAANQPLDSEELMKRLHIQTVISDVLKKREAQNLRATKSILEKLTA